MIFFELRKDNFTSTTFWSRCSFFLRKFLWGNFRRSRWHDPLYLYQQIIHNTKLSIISLRARLEASVRVTRARDSDGKLNCCFDSSDHAGVWLDFIITAFLHALSTGKQRLIAFKAIRLFVSLDERFHHCFHRLSRELVLVMIRARSTKEKKRQICTTEWAKNHFLLKSIREF